MSKSTDEWMNWKYDLCENEIQCEGRTIAFADNSIFDIEDKAEFNAKVRDLGMKLSWMVARANNTPKLTDRLERLEHVLKHYATSHHAGTPNLAEEVLKEDDANERNSEL